VPVRELALPLAATEYVTVPLPEPPLPEVIVIQASLATALHPQPAPAKTLRLLLPPLEANDALVGEVE
jgi:hypothetical protein